MRLAAVFHIIDIKNQKQNLKIQPENRPQGPENLKILSWDNPVSPIDAKNSISFFVQFFRGYIRVLGGSVYMNTMQQLPLVA